MLNEKVKTARAIVGALLPAEASIDASIEQHCRLVLSIIDGARALRSGASTNHAAMMHGTSAIASLAAARDHAVSCHRELSVWRDLEGIDPRAAGCSWSSFGSGKPAVGLRDVSAA